MSAKPRFDPKAILADIEASRSAEASSSKQGSQASGSNTARDNRDGEDGDEDDFMSDKFLIPSSAELQPSDTYSDRRRKRLARAADHSRPSGSSSSRKTLREREEEARREGLDRDLLAEAEIVAGAGEDALPPQDKHGRRMWETLDPDASAPFAGRNGEGLPSAGSGTNAAMRMMLSMGYKRGMALGKRQNDQTNVEEEEEEDDNENDNDDAEATEEGAQATSNAEINRLHARRDADSISDSDEDDTDAEEASNRQAEDQTALDDDYLSGGVSTAIFGASIGGGSAHASRGSAQANAAGPSPKRAKTQYGHPLTEPLRIDDRWLNPRSRLGIGMSPLSAKAPSSVSSAIAAATTASASAAQSEKPERTAEQQMQDFRSRVASHHLQRHEEGLLSRARKTVQELDRAQGVAYNPFWLDRDLWLALSGQTAGVPTATELSERIERDPATREAVELLEFAFGGEVDVTELEREGQEVSDEVKLQARQRREEAEAFCRLDTKTRLEITLSRLREEQFYCLFCGCKYGSREEMERFCPGTEEDDHD